MADSVVDICNASLVALGEDPITSLSDATKRASLCALRYDGVRVGVLEGYPWHCATSRALLPALIDVPLFGYANAFQLPADCLRVIKLDNDEDGPWIVEGRTLLCNASAPLGIIYIFDLTDTTRMAPMLRDVIALELAVDLCEALNQSDTRIQRLQQRLENLRPRAQTISAQQRSPAEWDTDVLLRSRR